MNTIKRTPDNEAIVSKLGERAVDIMARVAKANRTLLDMLDESVKHNKRLDVTPICEVSTELVNTQMDLQSHIMALNALTSPSAADEIADDISRIWSQDQSLYEIKVENTYDDQSLPAIINVKNCGQWEYSDRIHQRDKKPLVQYRRVL